MQFPFTETKIKHKLFLREFKESVSQDDLIWHLDKEDRIIEVIKSDKWYIQMDNELPKELIEGKKYKIGKLKYHRLIKGSGDLILALRKLD
tara:strand:- start:440 stop:712 length:273 start_codon:yes stop_codon:yes gene_type:complete